MFSGFGSIQRYDNVFGPSNFNAEDIDDFLAMQRDWGIDGGLRTVPVERIEALRRGAVTPKQLTAMAGELAGRGLPRCAALLTEAAEVYARRGLSA